MKKIGPIEVSPNNTPMAILVSKTFERSYAGSWTCPPIIYADDLLHEDIEAGLTLISEQATKQGYDAKFNGFPLKDFADKFLRG